MIRSKDLGMVKIEHCILLLFLLLSVEVEAMPKMENMRRLFGAAYKQMKLLQDECYDITGCSPENENCPEEECKCKYDENHCIPIDEFDCHEQGCSKEAEVCPEEICDGCNYDGGYCKYWQPHIVVVPSPNQGHVKPLLQLSHRLVDHGIKVTFVNTDFIHAKVTASMSKKEVEESKITLASIPDGLETDADRNDPIKFPETSRRVMPVHFKDLIEKINSTGDPVTCVIVDVTIGWMLDVVKSIGLEGVAFLPMSAANLALLYNIPNLLQAGIIDIIGTTIIEEEITLSKDIPPWNSNEIPWRFPLDQTCQKVFFEYCVGMKEGSEEANWLLCNTVDELEQQACNLIPKLLPVGPLHVNLQAKHSAATGSFWLEEKSCLTWLDKQKPGSVIYVSFGSHSVMSQTQFNELALGLQETGVPFLWIVRADLVYGLPAEYPEGFLGSVADQGKIVKWAPQDKVLSHPAIACFLSHCGWNSTLEGLCAGVPFLCWPFFGDQYHNRNYICDAWRVGLKLSPDENGIVSSNEISTKIGQLLLDGDIKENATKMKDLLHKSFSKEGSSSKNFEKFINHLKNGP